MSRLPTRVWRLMMRSMPIPCVDAIVERDAKILIGFRAIEPYRNVWALPGGGS
jgi:ADP-ribose pyrophosphatase YjhB (NUDIX family)